MICLIVCLIALCNPALLHASHPSFNILIIKSGSEPYYNKVVDHIDRYIDQHCNKDHPICPKIKIDQSITNGDIPIRQEYNLVVTLGLKAKDYAQRHLDHYDTIYGMIPQDKASLIKTVKHSKQHRTIILDQPIERSLFLIRMIIPHAQRIGILLRPANAHNSTKYDKIGQSTGFSIQTDLIKDESEIGSKLSQLLDKIDVLLALPDVNIYNRQTVPKILLSSYRKNIPVIGYSSAYVKAGALAAVFSSPEDIGKDIGKSILELSQHTSHKKYSIYPRFYSVSINKKVGASLGIFFDAEPAEIVTFIQNKER